MTELQEYLKRAVEDGASDLFIVAGAPVCLKLDKRLQSISKERIFPEETERLITDIYHLAGRTMDNYIACGDDDFSFSLPGLARFRVNAYRQRGSLAAVVRIVSFDIPSWRDIGIPKEIINLASVTSGMVLVTGTAGSGKSTTQACLIDHINHTREAHIITLEDPIEYLHKDHLSIVSQREMSIDTEDYLSALRACLRQSPDVILLGEMRDHETIRMAITGSETGYLGECITTSVFCVAKCSCWNKPNSIHSNTATVRNLFLEKVERAFNKDNFCRQNGDKQSVRPCRGFWVFVA